MRNERKPPPLVCPACGNSDPRRMSWACKATVFREVKVGRHTGDVFVTGDEEIIYGNEPEVIFCMACKDSTVIPGGAEKIADYCDEVSA